MYSILKGTEMKEEERRKCFEEWLHYSQGIGATWDVERNCYKDLTIHIAWKAYQAGAAMSVESEAE